MRKDVRGLDEVGTIFWGLPGALCPPGGSTPALISFSSRCPQPHCLPTLLARHLSGRRPSLRGLIGDQAGVYALPFGGVLAPAGLFAAPSSCAEPLPRVPFPTDLPNLPLCQRISPWPFS